MSSPETSRRAREPRGLSKTDVIDCTERLNTRQADAEFLLQFAADSLLGTLARFNTAARRR
jgi:hypothetical protein